MLGSAENHADGIQISDVLTTSDEVEQCRGLLS